MSEGALAGDDAPGPIVRRRPYSGVPGGAAIRVKLSQGYERVSITLVPVCAR
jgi:hypothetical protein